MSFKPHACKLVLCALQLLLYFIFVLAMALTLAVPKNFKFCRIFLGHILTLQALAKLLSLILLFHPLLTTTHVGESSDKRKFYEKNHGQFQLLWLPFFLWVEPIYKDEEATKVICKVCSKIRGKSTILVANSDNLWKH